MVQNRGEKHCLYITYDELLDPLGKTQILPYLGPPE